jgi:hypothetical protein
MELSCCILSNRWEDFFWKIRRSDKMISINLPYTRRAELFVSYDLDNMTFASYMNTSKGNQFIDLSIYDMGNPTNAYGVFAAERSTGKPAIYFGRAGYSSDANYFIWKGRYDIRIIASDVNQAWSTHWHGFGEKK